MSFYGVYYAALCISCFIYIKYILETEMWLFCIEIVPEKLYFPPFKAYLFVEIKKLYFCVLSFDSGEVNLL